MSDASTPAEQPGSRWPQVTFTPLSGRLATVGPWLDRGVLVAVTVVGLVLRVLQRSPLWLDEALSVNIASLPLADIPDALSRDGHPPLYYFLLHGWMEVFGSGDLAVRLLSGVIGLALVPLAAIAAGRLAGQRAAWATAAVVAVNPFVIRYATEARMYELVMVLAIAGWLVADQCLRRPKTGHLVLLAVITGALIWTHYWGIWLTAASGLGLVVRAVHARRLGDDVRFGATVKVMAALVGGALTFLPWAPTLIEQAAHTGTPWAEPSLPTEMVATSLVDLAGGLAGESVILAVVLSMLMALGLFGVRGRGAIIELDLHTRPEVRRLALTVALTLALAWAVSFVGDAAYASRYFAVVAPLVLVLIGVGVARIDGPVAFRLALAVVLLLGVMASTRAAVTRPRTQAADVATAIIADTAPGSSPLVVICPDQLGPSISRELPDGYDIGTYPDFDRPELVDWVDYVDRLAEASPEDFAAEALERADGRDLWLVWSGTYRTHEGTCETVANELQRVRPGGGPVVLADPDAFEQANAYRFPTN